MKNTEKKSSTRIEKSSKNTFKVTKSAYAKALRLIESANMGKLNIPYQNALDEIYGKAKVSYNQKEADRYLLQLSIAGEKSATYIEYIPSKDEFKTLQGAVITMGLDFVSILADMIKGTSYVSPAAPASEEDDFNEPLSDNEPEIPFNDSDPVGDDDFED